MTIWQALYNMIFTRLIPKLAPLPSESERKRRTLRWIWNTWCTRGTVISPKERRWRHVLLGIKPHGKVTAIGSVCCRGNTYIVQWNRTQKRPFWAGAHHVTKRVVTLAEILAKHSSGSWGGSGSWPGVAGDMLISWCKHSPWPFRAPDVKQCEAGSRAAFLSQEATTSGPKMHSEGWRMENWWYPGAWASAPAASLWGMKLLSGDMMDQPTKPHFILLLNCWTCRLYPIFIL